MDAIPVTVPPPGGVPVPASSVHVIPCCVTNGFPVLELAHESENVSVPGAEAVIETEPCEFMKNCFRLPPVFAKRGLPPSDSQSSAARSLLFRPLPAAVGRVPSRTLDLGGVSRPSLAPRWLTSRSRTAMVDW